MNKIKSWWKAFTSPFKNTYGLFKSLWFFIGKPTKARVFYGFWHWELSKKYARKRFNWWPAKFNQIGKPQGVFADRGESLIVISPMEIKLLKKRNYIDNQKWYTKTFNKENLYKIN